MSATPGPRPGQVLCIGGAVVDRKLHLLASSVPGTSNPARSWTAHGGVARNVAATLALLAVPVALLSRVGDDAAGRELLAFLDGLGCDRTGVAVDPLAPTAQYVAVLEPDGALVVGAADMSVLERIGVPDVDRALAARPGWVLADCNPSAEVLGHLVAVAREKGQRLCIDATSTPKVVRLPADLTGVSVLFCNRSEAAAWLARHAQSPEPGAGFDVARDVASDVAADVASDCALAERLRVAGSAAVVLTRGADGLVLVDDAGARALTAPRVVVVDVTGAGDALVAGTLAGLSRGWTLDDAAGLGVRLAALTVQSEHSVVTDLPDDLRPALEDA